ncbi:MAG: heparinase II/III family protein [Clostridia bacterium]|nr:heparinase II/III family protein [Clostridia bacterium]
MFDFTKEQITAALDRHPKSLIYRTDEDRARVLRNPNLERYRADLNKCIEHYLAAPLYAIPFSMLRRFEDDGDRSEFEYAEKGYFVRRGHLEAELIGAWLYPERPELLTAFQDTAWAICDEYTWSLAAHMFGSESLRANLQEDCYTIDLFAAETGATLAEALLLLEGRLDSIVVKRIKRELKKRIIDRFESGRFGWCETTTNNWAAVCAGSVGMACMCELDDNVRLGSLLEHLLKAMRNFISGFSDDGACLEGTGYWSYGFGYFSCFADMLYRRTGGEINLFDDKRVHDIALFPQKCCFYGSRGVSFSDSGSKTSLSLGLTNMLSKHYDDVFIPENMDTSIGMGIGGCHRFSSGFCKVLWTPEGEIERVPMVGNYQLPAAQWYIASGKDNVGLAIKGGNNGEPHNHNDIGSFLVYKNGTEIIADLGSGEYSKQYFREGRYSLTHCGSQGHSVPIIGGAVQKAGAQFAARDFTMDDTGVKMDIAPAYGLGEGASVYRELRFNASEGEITVEDTFSLAEDVGEIIERFISRHEPIAVDGGVRIGNEKNSMVLSQIEGKSEIKIHSTEEKDHGGRPFTVWYVDFVASEKAEKQRLVFRLV